MKLSLLTSLMLMNLIFTPVSQGAEGFLSSCMSSLQDLITPSYQIYKAGKEDPIGIENSMHLSEFGPKAQREIPHRHLIGPLEQSYDYMFSHQISEATSLEQRVVGILKNHLESNVADYKNAKEVAQVLIYFEDSIYVSKTIIGEEGEVNISRTLNRMILKIIKKKKSQSPELSIAEIVDRFVHVSLIHTHPDSNNLVNASLSKADIQTAHFMASLEMVIQGHRYSFNKKGASVIAIPLHNPEFDDVVFRYTKDREL